MPITPLFAGIFAIMYVWLSFGVIRHRLNTKISLGDKGDKALQTAVRVHGNFVEYVPISLILFWFLEIVTYSSGLVFVLGCVLLVARCSHVIGLKGMPERMIFRQIGMIATFAVILISSAVLIWHYLPF